MHFQVSRVLWRGLASGLAVGALTLLAASSGCSSKPEATSTSGSQAVCPATPADTVGQACSVEGLQCGPQYACGATMAVLSCVCTGGTFQCTDVTGAQLSAGQDPACPKAKDAGQACPATEAAANLYPCQEQGAQCAYPAKCDGGVPAYDTCYCFTGETNTGKIGLRWECSNTCGGANSPLPDAGSGADDGGPQPVEAGPTDAGATDAASE